VNSTVRTFVVWAFILAFILVLITWVQKGAGAGGKDTEITYSDLFNLVKQGKVMDAEVQGAELHGHMKATPKEEFHTHVGDHFDPLEAAFLASDAHFSKKAEQSNMFLPLLINVGPILLFGFIFFFFMRQMRRAATRPCPLARAARGCSACSRRRLPSRTWPAWTRPRKS